VQHNGAFWGVWLKQYSYSFSFTSSTAAIQESVSLAKLFLEQGDWGLVRDLAQQDNLFKARTLSSSGRLCREVISRLQTLSHAEIQLLVTGHETEQQQLIWLAICQRYAPIREFALEVLVEHYYQSHHHLAKEAFDTFYHRKAEWHVELEQLAPATVKKARWVVFSILKACGLLNADNLILPQTLSTPFRAALGREERLKSQLFPGAMR
jgi:hypothetical protein